MDPVKRLQRIEELQILVTNGKATKEEKAEFKNIMAEQLDWANKNPSKAFDAQQTFKFLKKTPEDVKKEYEQATKVEDKGKFDVNYYQGLLRADPIAAKKYKDSFDTRTPQEKIADAGSGSYGSPNIREVAIPPQVKKELPPIVAGKPDVIQAPIEEQPPIIEEPVVQAPAEEQPPIVEEPIVQAPVEEQPSVQDRIDPSKSAIDIAKNIDTDKTAWKDKIKTLGTKYGVPALEILEAVGKQRGGITGPTALDRKYQEKIDEAQKKYMAKLEKDREEREAALYEKRIADQRAYETEQARIARETDDLARKEEFGSREKLLQMQLAAQKAGARTSAPASIIPE